MMPYYVNSNAVFQAPVYDRIWKYPQRIDSAPSRSWSSKGRVLDQEPGDAFELVEESLGYERARVFGVEVQGVGDVPLGARVKRIGHRESFARWRVMAT